MFASWMRILSAAEGSCLWLLADAEQVEENFRGEAARAGVDASRLVFSGRVSLSEYFGRYRWADLFLDTLPFNGGTTANDALWAGLPVLTRPGGSFAGRMATSLLKTLDLPELIVDTEEEYEAAAIRYARNPDALHSVKDKLRWARETAPLFDMPRYTRHLEAAYREMVKRFRAGLPSDHIHVAPLSEKRVAV
jgi:predicted O-linked N-acetylglucosamine transferase (SPINDLY family)